MALIEYRPRPGETWTVWAEHLGGPAAARSSACRLLREMRESHPRAGVRLCGVPVHVPRPSSAEKIAPAPAAGKDISEPSFDMGPNPQEVPACS